MGFSAPAFRVAARNRQIGWDEDKRALCLNHAVICLSRFLIRPMTECRNPAIRALKLCFDRLGDDFDRIHRFRTLPVETFVDAREHAGTAFVAPGCLLKALEERGSETVIPPLKDWRRVRDYDRDMYGRRHWIENFFCKGFRTIATQYDKTDASFAAAIELAAGPIVAK